MKTFRALLLATGYSLLATGAAHSATPLTDVQMSGANNQVKSGATLTNAGTLTGAGTFNFSLGTLTLAANQIGWTTVNKAGSSLADFTTRSAADLTTGILPIARLAAINLAAAGGGGVTGNLLVTNLNSGTGASGTTFWRGDGTWATPPGGTGTVTAAAGTLTANAVVLGSGTTDTKVAPGITTDGLSKLNLGVPGTSVGAITLANTTSGTITLAPPTGALGTVTLTVPVATDTLVGRATADTLTNKSISGATNTITSVSLATGVTGNLPVANLNSGTAASGTTFWRGDGTWAAPTGGGTVTATAGALTANAVVLGAGTTDTKVLASLGTTTTLLHGNAAGAPTFGAVSLSADVTGNLPVTNLASGTAASSATYWRGDGTWATPAGSGTVTATAGALTANALVVGNGTTDTKVLASLGTTTTVLHGNAAGLPTFGAVSLSADITGNLPVANLNSGTAASSTTFWRGDGTWVIPTLGARTIFVPATALTPSTTNGCTFPATVEITAGQPDVTTVDFDPSTEQYAQFSIAMPKSWNLGTVTVQFLWSHAATATNFGVVWAAQAVSVSAGSTIGTAFGTAQTVTDTGGTTNTLYISGATPSITVGGSPATGGMVFFRIYRAAANVADTLAINARLHGIRIIYTVNAATDN